ncbi:MAG: hypothetical protein U0625_04700 [Phycisphaerales bacterium]
MRAAAVAIACSAVAQLVVAVPPLAALALGMDPPRMRAIARAPTAPLDSPWIFLLPSVLSLIAAALAWRAGARAHGARGPAGHAWSACVTLLALYTVGATAIPLAFIHGPKPLPELLLDYLYLYRDSDALTLATAALVGLLALRAAHRRTRATLWIAAAAAALAFALPHAIPGLAGLKPIVGGLMTAGGLMALASLWKWPLRTAVTYRGAGVDA